MRSPRYKRHAGGVSTLYYHFVWCPKYRRAVLVGSVADRLTTLLYEKAQALATQIEAREIMPDHVHLFVCAPPTAAPHQLVNQCKGYTSRVLRHEVPGLKRRLPSLWSRSSYVGSAGHVSADTIKQYIEQQKRS